MFNGFLVCSIVFLLMYLYPFEWPIAKGMSVQL